jgi:hypothetical protein
MELIESDLKMIKKMFKVLDEAAAVEEVFSVKIIFESEGGDSITIGYTMDGDPAVINIGPSEFQVDSKPTYPNIHINPTTPWTTPLGPTWSKLAGSGDFD